MAGTHAGRVNRPSPWPWLVPVAALVAGTLFASSVRASQGEDLRTDQAQLPDLIRAQNRTNETGPRTARRPAGQGRRGHRGAGPRRPRDPEARAPGQRDRHGRRPHPGARAGPAGHPRRRQARRWRGAGRRRPRRLRHPPAGRAVGRQRAVGGRRRGDDAPGPAGRLDQRGAVRRQHADPPGPGLLPALRHHRHRQPRRDALARSTPTRPWPTCATGRSRSASATTWATSGGRPSPPTAARSCPSTPRSPPREDPSPRRLDRRAAHDARGPAAPVRRLAAVVDRRRRQPGAGPDRADPRGRLRPRHPGARCSTTASPRRSARTVRSPSCASRGSAATSCDRSSRAPAAPCWPWASATTSAPPGPGRSATSPSPGTAPPTAGRSTTSTGSSDGDRVVVETAGTVYVYEVTSREIVRPSDVDVIDPVPGKPGGTPTEAADHDDLVPPEVQRHPAVRRARPPGGRRSRVRSGCRPAG